MTERKSAYQKLKQKLIDNDNYWKQVEKELRSYIIDLIVRESKKTGDVVLPLPSKGIYAHEIMTHIVEASFWYSIEAEVKERLKNENLPRKQ